jgi:signal transduction histidine kinase
MSENQQSSLPKIENEMERILELSDFELDYTELQKYLQDLTNLAARVTNSEISLVNLIDSYTQWSVSKSGIDLDQMPREESVCQYTITGDKGFEVINLEEDERFKERFYVKGDPNLRYYYGIPLKTDNGHNIGALCVLDTESKNLDPEKKELLKLIANEVVRRLTFLRENTELKEKLKDMEETQRKVSHDIRGPLSGIIGIAEIMESELDPERAKDMLEMVVLIRKGGESLLELADQIMTQKSKAEEKKEAGYNISDFIEKLEKLYKPQAANKNIALTFETEEEFNFTFPKNKLIQIIGNIISNCIKFSNENGKVAVAFEKRVVENSANMLHITVQDDGVGMKQKTIDQILVGNAKSEDGTKGETGFGYGMNLVQHQIKKTNGNLSIDSEMGEGSTFQVTLPI